MRISGTEPSSVILSQTKKFKKLKSDDPKVSNQALAKCQTFLYISLPEKLIGKSHRPQNKTFNRGASPSVPDEL